MQSSNLNTLQHVLIFVFIFQLTIARAAPPSVLSVSDWSKRREDFHQSTSFNLSEKDANFVRSLPTGYSTTVHLPFWFDFELYKKLFSKNYASREEELARHDIFIKACVRTLRNRFLKVSKSESADDHLQIDENDDRFYEERVFKTTTTTTTTSTESSNLNTAGAIVSTTEQVIANTGTESFIIEFEVQSETEGSEEPLEKAIRLVKLQLEDIESKELLQKYLDTLNEDGVGCVKVKKDKWPKLKTNINETQGNENKS